MSEPTHWLIWDGDCNFCRRSVDWVRARDTRRQFHPEPFQTAPSPPMTSELRERAKAAVQVICPDGRVLEAGEAVAYVLGLLGYRWIARFLMFPPFRPVTEWAYRRVANNRNVFGRMFFRER